MSDLDKKEYETLPIPEEALTRGGVELLRVAMIDEKLYVSIRPGFKDPADWGDVLAEITRRLGVLYDMADTGFNGADTTVAVEEAYATAMGAKPVRRKTPHKRAPGKSAARTNKRASKKAVRKPAKRKKR
jgi:Domain of unknown function (DUF5076)